MKKIGFIALSGVRAHNEELTRLGLTLPGFVERNKVIASMPSLSLLTLAGMTPDTYAVAYHEIAELQDMDRLPDDFDLVAISTFSAQSLEAYDVARRYENLGIPVIMGGLHVSAMPEEAARYCTSVVVGEGEPLWPTVLEDFERNALEPIYRSPRPGSFDLRESPQPRFDLLNPDKYNRITVQTSRGCPHRCEFCASSILLTPRYKLKPITKVLQEIHAIKRIWPKPFIEFADDNSFVHRHHYKQLLRALIPEKLRWFTETDIAVAEDEDMLGLMRDAGCQQVLIGLESPSPSSLRGIELKNDWKRRRQDRYLNAIAKIQSYGITVNGCFILGTDGDTVDSFEETFRFVRESGLYEVQVTLLTAFPGTPLHERLLKEDRLIQPQGWHLCTLFDLNIRPKNMTVQELQSGFLHLVKRLYSSEETNRRRRDFKRRLRLSSHYPRSRPNQGYTYPTEARGDLSIP